LKYFIGMTFDQDCSQLQKIRSFQERVDPFRDKKLDLHVSLLPPFSSTFLRQEAIEDLIDILEGMFAGGPQGQRLLFNSYDLFYKNKGVLFLNSLPFTNLIYAQEALYDFLKCEEVQFKKQKRFSKRSDNFFTPLMLLGKFWDERAMDLAHYLFKECIEIPISPLIKDVVLFEKINNDWLPREKLFSFESSADQYTIDRVLTF